MKLVKEINLDLSVDIIVTVNCHAIKLVEPVVCVNLDGMDQTVKWVSTKMYRNVFFSFDIFMVYIPECKQQLRTMKYTQIRDIAHFQSGL
jgi:hypothetical protein